MTLSYAIRKLYAAGKLRRPYHPGMLYWREPGWLPERLDERCPDAGELLTWEPVLDDHATRGCLLALLREAAADKGLFVQYRGNLPAAIPSWAVQPSGYSSAMPGAWGEEPLPAAHTEGEVIAAALVRLAEAL